MNFNSYIFVLLFLPLTVGGYFLLNKLRPVAGTLYLLGMSLWFYGFFNPKYLLIIIGSILVNYALSRLFRRFSNPQKDSKNKTNIYRKLLLAIGVILNLSVIFYFKYYDFFIANMNNIFHLDWMDKNMLLPLGISFFTFQQISFVVDSYRGETGDYSFFDYALFVTFFPQLVAGPIVLHSELIPQLQDESKRSINFDNVCVGIMKFTFGLSKKMLLADVFGSAADWAFSDYAVSTSGDLLLAILCYTLQIYFDFSGYSDMACGLAQMFNIELPINFNSPYKSDNVVDFWARWHMTLTRFLKTYVYIPLGGSRRGKLRKYINLMIVFLLSGIWHGANWNFIIWGIMHGVWRVLYEIFKKPYDRMNSIFKWMVNFMIINLTWLMFRVFYWKDYFTVLKIILRAEKMNVTNDMLNCFMKPEIEALLKLPILSTLSGNIPGLLAGIYIVVAMFICLNCENTVKREYKLNIRSMLVSAILLAFCIVSMSSVSKFLYFNF